MARSATTDAPLRLAFMGTPAFAVPSLEALIGRGHDIVCVYTQPPRPAGRGKRARKSPVHLCADKHAIPIRHPNALGDKAEQDAFADLAVDTAVVAAYGLILPVPILAAPRLGCINVHASLLPRWRGAAPIQRAILAGDDKTGITIMKMEAGLDTGPVIETCETAIAKDETAATLHDRLASLGADCLIPALEAYAAGQVTPVTQSDEGVCYAGKIDKAESRIDWRAAASDIDRQVRALSPFPGAWTTAKGERLKIVFGRPVADMSGEPGRILDDRLTVACGDGAYRVLCAQRPGRRAADVDALLRGFDLPAGSRLG